jgi:rhodanese-related sulfurtransferase
MEPGWKPVQPHELPQVLQRPKSGGEPCLVIDTREPAAYFEAHIDGSINVPVPTFTPRSGAEFGHMYSLTQLESDIDMKAARKFQGRRGRRVLIYDDGQGTEPGAGCSADCTAFPNVSTLHSLMFQKPKPHFIIPQTSCYNLRCPLTFAIAPCPGSLQPHMQHLQGGGFRIYPCLFLASLLEEERRVSDPNSQPCAELYILVGGMPPPTLQPVAAIKSRAPAGLPALLHHIASISPSAAGNWPRLIKQGASQRPLQDIRCRRRVQTLQSTVLQCGV